MKDLSKYEEITDLDFSAKGSHIAVCSALQGGSANGFHDIILAKSDELHDSAILGSVRLLKSLGEDVGESLIEKANISYNNLRTMLTDAVRNSYGEVWVADFTDKVVIFNDDGTYYAQPYKHRRGKYELVADRANVIECQYWELDPNNVVSEETKKLLESGSDIVITKAEQGVLAELIEKALNIDGVLDEIQEEIDKAVYKESDEGSDDPHSDDDDDSDPEDNEDDSDDEDDDDEDEEDDDDDIGEEALRKYLSDVKAFKKDDKLEKSATPMKTFRGKKYPAKDFAYVPDKDKPSTWKLPIFDAEHARLAAQALSSKGLMGNKVQIPSEHLASVKHKVAAANKKFKNEINKSASNDGVAEENQPQNGEMTVENLQDLMKSAEFQEFFKAQLDAARAEDQEVIKSLQSRAEALEIEKAERRASQIQSFVKASKVLGDNAEKATEFLLKATKEDASFVIDLVKSFDAKFEELEAEKEEVKKNFATEIGHGQHQTTTDLEKSVLDSFSDDIKDYL